MKKGEEMLVYRKSIYGVSCYNAVDVRGLCAQCSVLAPIYFSRLFLMRNEVRRNRCKLSAANAASQAMLCLGRSTPLLFVPHSQHYGFRLRHPRR